MSGLAGLRRTAITAALGTSSCSSSSRFLIRTSVRTATLATELVVRHVGVMVVNSNAGAVAAKAATSTIPIVFMMGGDPVKFGFVASFNRPGEISPGRGRVAARGESAAGGNAGHRLSRRLVGGIDPHRT
jgi:hypothetical protein